jgi:hypothetical protein
LMYNMNMETIRFIIFPILVAAGVGSLVSFAWYAFFLEKRSPVIREEIAGKKSLQNLQHVLRASFVAHVFSATAILMLIEIFQIRTFAQGSRIIFAICFFLIAVSGLKKVLVEKKSLENFILGAGHDFVNIVVTFAILIFLAKH